MKVAVLTPTRGDDRKVFLSIRKKLLQRQTFSDFDEILIDHPPKSDKPDINERYIEGLRECEARGYDAVILWEDDDYYCPTYIEQMLRHWDTSGRPGLYGYNVTIYYHIIHAKYRILPHAGRASACCTLVGSDAYSVLDRINNREFFDIQLWRQNIQKMAVPPPGTPSIGIKHNVGKPGGSGHRSKSGRPDPGYRFLKLHTEPDIFDEYMSLACV